MSPGAPAQALLEARGITVSFGAVQALAGVDFAIGSGEIVGLIGDNGAGKSTLVRVIAGLVRPDAGSLLIDGQQVHFDNPAQAASAGIATVYQDLALCDNLDIVANLFLGREVAGRGGSLGVVDEAAMEHRTQEVLAQLGATNLPDLRAQVSRLSGGQRQAVAIARAMLGSPRVVLLDEPTAALGVTQTQQVLELARTLRDRGIGVVLISHNMANLTQVCDRFHVLRQGRTNGVFGGGTPAEQLVAAITGASWAPPAPPTSGAPVRIQG